MAVSECTCTVAIIRRYDLINLTRDEVTYLLSLLQNPLMYLDGDVNEPMNERQMREHLFNQLTGVLHK